VHNYLNSIYYLNSTQHCQRAPADTVNVGGNVCNVKTSQLPVGVCAASGNTVVWAVAVQCQFRCNMMSTSSHRTSVQVQQRLSDVTCHVSHESRDTDWTVCDFQQPRLYTKLFDVRGSSRRKMLLIPFSSPIMNSLIASETRVVCFLEHLCKWYTFSSISLIRPL